jgi:hypothetical protein
LRPGSMLHRSSCFATRAWRYRFTDVFLLTGSKSASVLAILPLLDVYADCPELILKDCVPLDSVAFLGLAEPMLSEKDADCSWRHWLLPATSDSRSFPPDWPNLQLCDKALSLLCWVDNIFAFASTEDGAAIRFQCVEEYFARHWGLRTKPGSKEVLPGKGATIEHLPGWVLMDHLAALGDCISADADSAECQSRTLAAVWRSFWTNFRGLSASLGAHQRLRHLTGVVEPVVSFRASRWLWQISSAKAWRSQHLRMATALLRLRKGPEETWHQFGSRRAREISIHGLRLWDETWAISAFRWQAHLDRHSYLPAAQIRHCLTIQTQINHWRRTCRALQGCRRSLGTRRCLGRPRRTADSVANLVAKRRHAGLTPIT